MKKVFDDDCPIVPDIVADCVVREACQLFDHLVTADDFYTLSAFLAAKAETIAQANSDFRRKILGPKGTLGRDRLYAFMRHWLSAKLFEQHGERVRDSQHRAAFEAFSRGEDPSGSSRVRVF